jgi:hypothetical protein
MRVYVLFFAPSAALLLTIMERQTSNRIDD